MGEQDVDRPAGEDVAFRLTFPEKPPIEWSEIVAVAESFTTNETLFGFAVKEKSGTNTRTSIVVERTSDPLVPEIVTTYVPALFAVSVHVEVSLPVRLDGTHEVVTPVGTETAVKLTVLAKPPVDEREIVELADCPVPNDTLAGFADREKSGDVTVAAIVAVWTKLPLVPVIVTV